MCADPALAQDGTSAAKHQHCTEPVQLQCQHRGATLIPQGWSDHWPSKTVRSKRPFALLRTMAPEPGATLACASPACSLRSAQRSAHDDELSADGDALTVGMPPLSSPTHARRSGLAKDICVPRFGASRLRCGARPGNAATQMAGQLMGGNCAAHVKRARRGPWQGSKWDRAVCQDMLRLRSWMKIGVCSHDWPLHKSHPLACLHASLTKMACATARSTT